MARKGTGKRGKENTGKIDFFPLLRGKRETKCGYMPQRIKKWRRLNGALIYGNLIQNM
jgi:hypothetical protein